jgi:hypothetical protein
MTDNTAADLVPDGARIVVENNEDYMVVMTRVGDTIRTDTYAKNLQAMFDQNAEEAAEFNATGKHSDMVKVAGIPAHLYFQWLKEGIIDDKKALRKRLNDSEFAKFRTNNWTV